MEIKNCPSHAWDYEFIILNQVGENYVYVDHSDNGFIADQMASKLKNGVVAHNVRIQGKKED